MRGGGSGSSCPLWWLLLFWWRKAVIEFVKGFVGFLSFSKVVKIIAKVVSKAIVVIISSFECLISALVLVLDFRLLSFLGWRFSFGRLLNNRVQCVF